MTGSIQFKHGKYYAVINFNKDGKRKQKWINTNIGKDGSKKELQKFLRNVLCEYENKSTISKKNEQVYTISFSDYIVEWLKEAKLKVDIITYQHYKNDAENHIIPYFKASKIKLIDVDRQVLQNYFNNKAKHGRLDGNGGLSPKTLRNHKNIIYQSLNLAYVNELIERNPCNNITLPQKIRYDYDFYNLDEINHFLKVVKNEELYPLYLFTVTFGLRRSEVLEIKWKNINLDKKTLTIKSTVTRANTIVEKDKTKTEANYRTFPLNDYIIDFLVLLKNREKENKLLFGNEYIKNDYVFKWDNGKPYNPDYITSKFSKTIKKYNLKKIRFHDLRHSCASLLNAQGYTLKDIQEWLGHADIQTTANTYAHLDIERKKNITNCLSNIIEK